MFDFAWSELALIAVVALIAIGPKDMPAAIRAVTGWVKKARRMAAEFQTHVDEMVREADLSEIRSSINEIRNFNVRGEIERAVDADGSLRSSFASDPFKPVAAAAPAVTSVEEIAVSEAVPEHPLPPPEQEPVMTAAPACAASRAPAFVPPNLVPPDGPQTGAPEAPAFIPPNVARQRRAHPAA